MIGPNSHQIRIQITYIRVCDTLLGFAQRKREEKGVPGGSSSPGKSPTRRAAPARRSHEPLGESERPRLREGTLTV